MATMANLIYEPAGRAREYAALACNVYRGCEHGCIYCYARPSHAYLNLSPGVDFETRLFAKVNAAELLREELAKPSYRASPIALGANTDCYHPIERKHRITRALLEVLAECEGVPVLAREGSVTVASFHPELTPDARLHEQFLRHHSII